MINIQENISLSKFTTFRIGGPAQFFTEANSETEAIEALNYAKDNNLPFFILGGGSNILVSDAGFRGLVIKMKLDNFSFNDNIIAAESGVSTAKLVRNSIENNLSGLEWAAGLPGNLGGAIRGNAGTFGFSMRDAVEEVKIFDLDSQKIEVMKNSECEFGYRDSIFRRNSNLIILSAVLKLQTGEKNILRQKFRKYIVWRKTAFPESMSPGSFFKHAKTTEHNLKKIRNLPRFSELKLHEKNTIPAGFIIEEAGLKGKKMGGAMISEKHANFIINTGNATAQEVVMLASFIKQQVRDEFGIELKEEVRYVGF